VPADRTSNSKPDTAPEVDVAKLRQVEPKELLIRFALGAIVSIVAGVISKTLGVRLGGVFLAFPAILPASLTFVQDKEGTRKADRTAIGAVLGGAALVGFAAVGEALFSRLNSALVLAAALTAWTVAILVFYATLAIFRPDDCDKHQD
jgi:uncharacterized membrane protein (GlpM family)